MKHRSLYLTPGHRRLFYIVCLLVFLSGAIWATLHYLDQASEISERFRRYKPWLLSVHGLAAVGFVLLTGTLLSGHVPRAWRAEKNRANGAVLLTAVASMIISGYLLYYLSEESWRKFMSLFHLGLGLLSPGLLIWHIRSGRRTRDAQ